MRDKLFSKHSAGLNEEAALKGLVRHAHRCILSVLPTEPAGYLLRRPVFLKLPRHHSAKFGPRGKDTFLRTSRSFAGTFFSSFCAIRRSTAVTRNLTADDGWRAECRWPSRGRFCPLQRLARFLHAAPSSAPATHGPQCQREVRQLLLEFYVPRVAKWMLDRAQAFASFSSYRDVSLHGKWA